MNAFAAGWPLVCSNWLLAGLPATPPDRPDIDP